LLVKKLSGKREQFKPPSRNIIKNYDREYRMGFVSAAARPGDLAYKKEERCGPPTTTSLDCPKKK